MRGSLRLFLSLLGLWGGTVAQAQETRAIDGFVVRVQVAKELANLNVDKDAFCDALRAVLAPGKGPWGFGISRDVACDEGASSPAFSWQLRITAQGKRARAQLCRPESRACEGEVGFPLEAHTGEMLADERFVRLLVAGLLDGLPFVARFQEGLVDGNGKIAARNEPANSAYAIPAYTARLAPVSLRRDPKTGIIVAKPLPKATVEELKRRDDVWLQGIPSGRSKAHIAEALERASKEYLREKGADVDLLGPHPRDWTAMARIEGGGFVGPAAMDLRNRTSFGGSVEWGYGLGRLTLGGARMAARVSIPQSIPFGTDAQLFERKVVEVNNTTVVAQGLAEAVLPLDVIEPRVGLAVSMVTDTLDWQLNPLGLVGSKAIREVRRYPAVVGFKLGFVLRPDPGSEIRFNALADIVGSEDFRGWQGDAGVAFRIAEMSSLSARGLFVHLFFRGGSHSHGYRYKTQHESVNAQLVLEELLAGLALEARW